MIKHTIFPKACSVLWKEYVKIDFGRAVPEKNYKGFASYLMDISKADAVVGRSQDGHYELHFKNEKNYVWFLLKWGGNNA